MSRYEVYTDAPISGASTSQPRKSGIEAITAATLAHSIATRRFPREMAGRVNTALNTFTFLGIFIGQWATGAMLNRFPPTATGYDPRGYAWAMGALALVQAAGLAWLWAGRAALAQPAASSGK